MAFLDIYVTIKLGDGAYRYELQSGEEQARSRMMEVSASGRHVRLVHAWTFAAGEQAQVRAREPFRVTVMGSFLLRNGTYLVRTDNGEDAFVECELLEPVTSLA